MDENEKYNIKDEGLNETQTFWKNRIESERDKLMNMIVERYIKEFDIDREKWYKILKNFSLKASKNVKPSGFMLDDEVDVNIICNEWGSHLDSAYINGVVIKKNVIDKRLNDEHSDPRILLLSNSLGYVRD